jgi:hypothetical protein
VVNQVERFERSGRALDQQSGKFLLARAEEWYSAPGERD